MSQRVFMGGLLVLSVSCAVEAPTELGALALGENVQPIIYGDDDRTELYAVTDPALREIGWSSVAAMINTSLLYRPPSGGVRVTASTLKQTYRLCDGERFEDQPAAASCSGVLIDRDLLLTAGHCIEDEEDCRENVFVFDYAYRRAGELETISASDVYGCRRIVARTFTNAGPDYAVIQLDRVPTGRSPVAVRKDPLEDGDRLAVLGFTSGLPMKVDLAASVQSARASMSDYFLLDSDTYEGSSGSAVLDSDNALAGVLVRGGEDYVETAQGCQVSKVYTGDRMPSWGWEQASYASQAIEELCEEVGFPSERLCGIKPSCGDGFCSFDAVDHGCLEDCEDVCTDGDCTKGGGGSSGPLVPSPGGDGDSKAKASNCSITGPAEASSTLEGLSLLALAFTLAVRATRRRA